ncbi:hydrogenase maturation nickel metallochaperone HypA [Rhodococcus opacus]|uniref:hydrogenase maturation nickel metallochaperone HypA/HybF n=1 Tax=Rhodococcus opacus TaxID=37919 RepID=UPI0007CD9343|nr:hydrogenase maturation nickel metallochaperone HypA [Rhodococcus opacus]MDX5962573.1 hydrogenase maturation nickel metallochaperone HypA [Rhodococcus opacus]
MHELSITQSVVDAVCKHALGRPVRSIRLEVGQISGVEVDAMEFCFELVARGTAAEGARLECDQPQGRAYCRGCDFNFATDDLILLCSCGSADVEITAGRDLRIISMEVG